MENKKDQPKIKKFLNFMLSPLSSLGKGLLYFFLFVFYLSLFGSFFGYFGYYLQKKIETIPFKGPIIAKLTFEGAITDNTAKNFLKKLRKVENYNQTKGILLIINSPGGAIGPTQEIYYELLHIKKEKHIPIVAFLKNIAASGGYYISLPADKIVALPGTITGSIGVFAEWIYVGDLLKKLGIEIKIIKAGKYKDIFNPFSKPTDPKLKLINQTIYDSYYQFLEAVSKNRNIPLDKVKNLAEGKIYTGRLAKKVGLVDYIGDYYLAENLIKKLSKTKNAKIIEVTIPKNPLYQILDEGKNYLKNIYNLFFGKEIFRITY